MGGRAGFTISIVVRNQRGGLAEREDGGVGVNNPNGRREDARGQQGKGWRWTHSSKRGGARHTRAAAEGVPCWALDPTHHPKPTAAACHAPRNPRSPAAIPEQAPTVCPTAPQPASQSHSPTAPQPASPAPKYEG